MFVYPITSIYTVNPHVITKVFEDLKQNAAETKKKKKRDQRLGESYMSDDGKVKETMRARKR